MNKPIVSVVMPAYNATRYIAASIESILNQTMTEFELIIIDDASTDNTADICKTYAERDKRIQLHSLKENHGALAVRNMGLKYATGKYFATQDADDISHADRLAMQVAYMEVHPDIALIGSHIRLIDEHNGIIGVRQYPTEPMEIRKRAICFNPFAASATLVRIDVLRNVGGYPESRTKIAEDYALWLRVLSEHNGANLDRFLMDYRLHQSAGKNSVRQKLKNTIRAQRPWLFHPQFRSLRGLLYHIAEHIMILLPQRLVLAAFQRRYIQNESQ